jgi:hypothetical protein
MLTDVIPAEFLPHARARNITSGRSLYDGRIVSERLVSVPQVPGVLCMPAGAGCTSRGFGVLMPRVRRWMLLGLAVILFASVSLAQTNASHPRHRRKPAPKPLVLPPLPPGPLPQLPMNLMPATPPKVGFERGLLTIVAQNSTLGDILQDVQKLTGASIDMPTKATERVVTRLGPGTPRDVLASLLNGSSFNYVMVGSPSDPSSVTSVVLSPKPTGPPPQTAGGSYSAYSPSAPAQPYVVQQVPPRAPMPGAVDNSNDQDQDASADDNSDQEQTDTNGGDQVDQPQPTPPNAGPKTPEQILEMLRRQQQQPPTATPNPQRPQQD